MNYLMESIHSRPEIFKSKPSAPVQVGVEIEDHRAMIRYCRADRRQETRRKNVLPIIGHEDVVKLDQGGALPLIRPRVPPAVKVDLLELKHI